MKVVEKIILASKSFVRKSILETLSVPFTVEPSKTNESEITAPSPSELALKRAFSKAQDVARESSLALVIGCDQVLSLKGKIFSKPKDASEAYSHLSLLQGKEHTLFSAVSLFYGKSETKDCHELVSWVSPVRMDMKSMQAHEIKSYVATEEWRSCVGGYRIEGVGSSLFSSFKPSDDKTVVMGLPLNELVFQLSELGCDLSKKPQFPFYLN